jgi:hypothetical protein
MLFEERLGGEERRLMHLVPNVPQFTFASWLVKDNRFLILKSSYWTIFRYSPCRLIR